MNTKKSASARSAKQTIFFISFVVSLMSIGCQPPTTGNPENSNDEQVTPGQNDQQGNSKRESANQSNGKVITSDGPITVENGKVTFGRPEVTEQVEKDIYKSLAYRLNMAEQIEKRNPGGNQASRNMREEYQTIKKGHMGRYGLSESDITRIMKKGESKGWK